MIRLLSIRSVLALALLLLAVAALAATLNTSLEGLGETAFLSLGMIALVTAYLSGFSSWPAYVVWTVIVSLGAPLIVVQVTGTGHEVGGVLGQLPALLLDKMLASMTGEPVDATLYQIQLDAFLDKMEIFANGLWSEDGRSAGPGLLELGWAVPLFVSCAWAGWWSSRRNSILIALIPSLAMQAHLLSSAHKLQGLSLQFGAFVFIVLLGLHEKWSLSKSESSSQFNVHLETYARVLILSAVLALATGLVPVIPAPAPATPTPTPMDEENPTTAIQQATPLPPSELPELHTILTPPPDVQTVVFMANVSEEATFDGDESVNEGAARRYYWRWLIYDRYDGKAWRSSLTNTLSYSADEALFEFDGQGYRVIHQTILKADAADGHLYWSGSLLRVDQPIEVSWRIHPSAEDPLLSMDMLGSLTQGGNQQYSADSLLSQSTERQLRAASQAYPPEMLEKYLLLPNTISQRVQDLATTLTAGAQNPYDKAQAIEAHLRTYPYTLDVPAVPADSEISDYFLFELKTGYCDYYATSMVVLARAAGLPARIVMGYVSDEYDPQTGQYIVRGIHAHSWVEIYFPDLGWIEFEPTANQPQIERPVEPVVIPTPTPIPDEELPPLKARDEISHQKHGYFAEAHLNPVILVILAITGICLLYLRTQGLRFSYKTIAAMYKYIFRYGRRIHPNTPSNATPSLFAEELKTNLRMDHRFLLPAVGELDLLTALYLKETYSRHAITRAERKQAVRVWRKLFWRLLYVRIILSFSRAMAK
jgi:transglutaminase-like putative cysteine protease